METPVQLSFDSLLEQQDHSATLALIPHTDLTVKEFRFPKRRFFILSILVHIAFAGYAVTLVVEKMSKPEVIEVTYESPAPAAMPMQASYSEPTPPAIESIPEPEPVAKPIAKPTNAIPKTAAVPVQTQATKATRATTTSEAEPLASISDIEVPVLTAVSEEQAAAPSMKEVDTDFDKIDEAQNEKLIAATKVDTKLLEDSISELEESSKEVSQEPSNLDALAAERLNHLKEQKLELKKSHLASAGPAVVTSKQSTTEKVNSAGVSEEPTETRVTTQAGVGSESEGVVRKLEDLKQKPGNPRPIYDAPDRKNGLAGTIIINAYVTKDGNLTLFSLIQSTGHRNLDRKTLSALKNWKFYPGQEGWVELPFKWDIKGGVQEDYARLRRVAK